MKLEIIVEKGNHQGQRLQIDRPGVYHVGRKIDNDLALTKDRYVSRRHCKIEVAAAGVCRIIDTSRGGTYVNENQIQRAQLGDGDKIKIGHTILHASLAGSAPRIPGFILEELFDGVGPGKVWSATSNLLDQPVALHFLALDSTEETVETEKDQQQRFLREAGICARAIHPGLLNFLDQNISGDILWFVTELAEGQNLQKLVEQGGALSVLKAAEVVSQALDVVAYLHQKGIVHRSLRPQSLQIQTEAHQLTIRLTDLGSAKCFQPLEFQSITLLGQRGFPVHAFSAPETVKDFNNLDSRSDLYAVGAILYFILAGRPPFELSKKRGFVTPILNEKPPALGKLKPNLSPAIVAVVERAMLPEPDQRYSSASEMLEALRQAIDTLQPLMPPGISPTHKWPTLGDVINDYEIISELGRGRMGTVYRARDTRTGREVALKLLRNLDQTQKPGDPLANRQQQRFEREVKLSSRLNHPHIVTVYDVNLTHKPPYLVMELLDGGSLEERLWQRESLDDWLQQGKTLEAWLDKQMPWSECLPLLRPLVQALAYTHQAGAVHRDVKPANIMFTNSKHLSPAQAHPEPGQGQDVAGKGILKLVDFGLAHWEFGEALTQTSEMLGAPTYLSPEQARGQPVDGRSDIFPVGLILFEMITGVNPLDKGPLFQTIVELGSDQPLDTRLLDRLKIPQRVISLIEQAIAKNPDERHPTCEALLAQMDACLETAIGASAPQSDIRPWDSRSSAGPVIAQENRFELNDEEKNLLTTLFRAHNRIVIETQYLKGFSGSRVLRVRPVDESGVRPYLPAVVKIGPRWLIEQEWRAYQAWVEKILPGIARLEGMPILGQSQGILRYALIGSGIFPVQSLHDYAMQQDAEPVRRLLVDRLFKILGRQWWQARRSDYSFQMATDYDSILPINLLVEYVDPSPANTVRRIEPNHLPAPAMVIDEYVQIKNFVVTRVDVPEQFLTLNLPPVSRGPASNIAQVPFGYRLRLTGIPDIERYRAGQRIELLSGRVTATRHNMLLELCTNVLPNSLNLAHRKLHIADNLRLPNPLLAYQDILGQTRAVYRSTIHGDLNLENILVDPETGELSLIDFATVRRGHSLHDLLRMESEVVTKLLSAAMHQAGLPLQTVPSFYYRLHQATANPDATAASLPLPIALQKSFAVIGTIRQEARSHLFDRTDWTEYYQGLTLYLLGTLKFKNLETMPGHPLPRQVLFWAAATVVELLYRQRSNG